MPPKSRVPRNMIAPRKRLDTWQGNILPRNPNGGGKKVTKNRGRQNNAKRSCRTNVRKESHVSFYDGRALIW